MTRKNARPRRTLLPFDAARHLKDDAAGAEYVNPILEPGEPDHLLLALGDVARARGMAKVDAALGVRLTAQAT